MASFGDQTLKATQGREMEAASRYKEFKDIIISNIERPYTFSEVIEEIANIKAGSFYNYISNKKQKGRVSLYTVKQLADFFDLPVGVFDCSMPFTAQHKETMISKLQKSFCNRQESEKEQPKTSIPLVHLLQEQLVTLSQETNVCTLEEAIVMLEQARDLVTERKKSIEKLKTFGKNQSKS